MSIYFMFININYGMRIVKGSVLLVYLLEIWPHFLFLTQKNASVAQILVTTKIFLYYAMQRKHIAQQLGEKRSCLNFDPLVYFVFLIFSLKVAIKPFPGSRI